MSRKKDRTEPFVVAKTRKNLPGNRKLVDYFVVDPMNEECPVVYLGPLEVERAGKD